MKKLVLIIAILTFNLGFSQTESTSKKNIANSFSEAYNNSNFEDMYRLFSKDYQNQKPLENVTTFLKRLQNSFGKIVTIGNAFNEEGFTKFPIQFKEEKRTLVLKIDIDNKIDYFSINK